MYRVTKRDGSITEFHIAKIGNAITRAFEAVGRQQHPSVIELLALRVTAEFEPKIRNELISVEDIQDCVERVLSEAGYSDVAKAYILYRKQREKLRNVGSTLLNYKELVDNYLRINDWRVKENSTVTYSVGGLILSNSGAITANYWLSEIYDAEIAQAHRSAEPVRRARRALALSGQAGKPSGQASPECSRSGRKECSIPLPSHALRRRGRRPRHPARQRSHIRR